MSAGPSGAAPAEAPGPPPLPPAGLASRPLPLHLLPAGTVLARIHRAEYEPLFFGPGAGRAPMGRWDAPAGEFGVCYLAEEARTAFAETFLRTPGETLLSDAALAGRSLARMRLKRALRLVALHGEGLARLGATAAVCSGPYAVCRAWSLALHGHPERPDGIRYRARHDDDGFAVALFTRGADALAVTTRYSLDSPHAAEELAAWLDLYGMGLI